MATRYAEGLFNALQGELNGVFDREQRSGYRFYAEASTTTCDFSELFGGLNGNIVFYRSLRSITLCSVYATLNKKTTILL